MYPTFGRHHINYLGANKLIFDDEPRGIFHSINYGYVVVGDAIYRIDQFYNQLDISGGQVQTPSGNIYFAYLVVNNITFACFVDSQKIYVYIESGPQAGNFYTVTDSNAPGGTGNASLPGFIAAFGNRIVVSVANSSQFFLSVVNLLNAAGVFDPATCFTINGAAVFAQEDGIIGQMGVLNTKLYIFTAFTTGIWSNIPSVFSGTGVTFPWSKNTSYEWNFGIADPLSLDINFGILALLARNSNGLLQVMVSDGGQPAPISTKAIDVLFQRYANIQTGPSPYLEGNSNGFLYEYENSIFFRLSAGDYNDYGILDQVQSANCIEYAFESKSWHRCIELNGERNRIQKHMYFNGTHLVTVSGEGTVYEMSGAFYDNEVENPNESNPQAADAYIRYPFRYERITPIISEEDYAEFETQYVEIDFVFGDSFINYSDQPFSNTTFIIDEQSLNDQPQFMIAENPDADGQPVFMITDDSNTPGLADTTYNYLYKPNVMLYWSDDGGHLFNSADNLEFAQMGVYQWRMRWYQLGPSRNRVYKLIAVSPVPIVVLGGVMMVRRISGGAN
jgi:hypothetical protein